MNSPVWVGSTCGADRASKDTTRLPVCRPLAEMNHRGVGDKMGATATYLDGTVMLYLAYPCRHVPRVP